MLFVGFVLIFNQNIHAQWWKKTEEAEKERSKGMLLLTSEIQLEASESINKLYNFKFADAERDFGYLKAKYPTHPLPDFLMGLSEWWKIVPNTDNALYDDRCLEYMDASIDKAEEIWDDSENPEAAFFMACAYAVKARLHAERKHWTKATFASKNALKYLDESRNFAEFSPELMFGDGLYNYYFNFIKENYSALKPVLWLFPKGDKAKGIKQLEKVAFNAFYTRTEARYFLLQIYGIENNNVKGYELSKYTHAEFPDNPFFHRYHARMAFVSGHTKEAEQLSKSILEKIESRATGYEGVSGRYASYILAYQAMNYEKNYDLAASYYQKAIDFAVQTNAKTSGYYLSSLLALGKIASIKKDSTKALTYFKKVMDDGERKSTQYQEAKKLYAEAKKKIRKAK